MDQSGNMEIEAENLLDAAPDASKRAAGRVRSVAWSRWRSCGVVVVSMRNCQRDEEGCDNKTMKKEMWVSVVLKLLASWLR